MPCKFSYSEFNEAVKRAGFGVCAAKRALKKNMLQVAYYQSITVFIIRLPG